MQQIFDRAIVLGLIQVNPSTQAGNVRRGVSTVEFWTLDEFNAFQAANPMNDLRNQLTYYAIHTFFYTGLRLGELQALTWADYNGKQLDVTKGMLYRNVDDFEFITPKTKSSIRKVGLDETTIAYLDKWKIIQSTFIQQDKNTFIFTDNHKPIIKSWLSKFITKYHKKANVPDIKTHALRHSHASYLISLGVDILSVSKRLGHSTTVETLKTYGHLYPNADENVLSVMNENIEKSADFDS